MVAKSAVMHIVKYQKVKIVSGEANLAARGFDGYTIFARIYHDVFVPDNKRVAIYCSVAAKGGAAPAAALDVSVKNGKIASMTILPGDKLYHVVTAAAGTSVGGTLGEEYKVAHIGDAVTATTTFYAVNSELKVQAVYTHTVA